MAIINNVNEVLHRIRYFVPDGASAAADASQRVKVTGHLADNTASRIVGIIPALAAGQWRVEVVTQYSGGTQTVLKTPRALAGKSVLTVPQPA